MLLRLICQPQPGTGCSIRLTNVAPLSEALAEPFGNNSELNISHKIHKIQI